MADYKPMTKAEEKKIKDALEIFSKFKAEKKRAKEKPKAKKLLPDRKQKKPAPPAKRQEGRKITGKHFGNIHQAKQLEAIDD